jgi:hypothetical protein
MQLGQGLSLLMHAEAGKKKTKGIKLKKDAGRRQSFLNTTTVRLKKSR